MRNIRHIIESDARPKRPVSSPRGAIMDVTAHNRLLHRIAGLWVTVLDILAPIGFEDETGFHFGEMIPIIVLAE
jgi:hypothetical protein